MKPRCKVWIVFEDQVKFGDGRANLLDLIDQLGSIKQAVAQFGMSYRNAWGYLKDLEEAAGFKLLERGPGGSPRSGTRLTQRGRQFLDRYRHFRAAVDTDVARRFMDSFRRH
jgi:molybdate transport system regulatory protein